MSYLIYIDKDGEPVRQMVSTDPELASRYRRVTVFTQEEVDEMREDDGAGECCPDCRSEHYNEGYADGESAAENYAEGRIEELKDTISTMADDADSAKRSLEDVLSAAESVGVCV